MVIIQTVLSAMQLVVIAMLIDLKLAAVDYINRTVSFKTPNMVDHCTCHTSRGGHAYFGVGAGTVPDVHLTEAGYNCMSCHTKHESWRWQNV